MRHSARIRALGVLQLGLAIASLPLSGCTLVGAGVGAGIDAMIPGPYETHGPAERVYLEHGKSVDLGLRNGEHVRGRYVGTAGPTARDPETYLIVEVDDAVASVPASELRTLGVEVMGKGWIYGGVIGLAIDVTLVVATIIVMQNFRLDLTKSDLSFN
jgi:hypothetical protein